MTAIVLEEAGPWVDTDHPVCAFDYRRCDFCDESAMHDIWGGKLAESEWRLFYRLLPDELNVCEHCLPRLLASSFVCW
jgi:hypothetical protein